MPVRLPRQFGRYRILRPIAEGGMGAVFLAHDTVMDAEVAIKVPHRNAAQSQQAVQRFYREARVMFGLRHPNVCPVYDVGEIDGHLYLVMAYIDGEPLSKTIAARGTFPEPDAAKLIGTIATALELAHQKGIVHRDLKPANIMLENGDMPIVMDFGLALQTNTDASRLTQTGSVIGTPAYMPIEQVMGQTDRIGPRTDVYSLGVILFEMLCGQLPFNGGVTEVLGQIIGADAPPVSEWNPQVDSSLETICLQAMAKQPEERYPTMQSFAEALAAYGVQPTNRQRTPASVGDSAPSIFPIAPPKPLRVSHSRTSSPERAASKRPTISGTSANNATKASRKSHSEPPEAQRKPRVPQIPWDRPLARTVVVATLLTVGLIAFILNSGSSPPPANPIVETNPVEPLDLMHAPFDETETQAGQQAWAEYLDQPKVQTNSIGMKLVLLPAGEFLMGSPEAEKYREDYETQHQVRITQPFYLGQTEVTQGQWEAVMGTTPWKDQGYVQVGASYATTYVSWEDAVAFCGKLTEQERKAGRLPQAWEYTLPTEAQWEYACRAGTKTAYSFGDDDSKIGDYAWYGGIIGDGNAKTEQYAHEVGQKKANPWGLYDMHGNVWEWCADWFDSDYYGKSPLDNPSNPEEGSNRVLRGGSWYGTARYCRSAYRDRYDPTNRDYDLGFRVARVLPSQ